MTTHVSQPDTENPSSIKPWSSFTLMHCGRPMKALNAMTLECSCCGYIEWQRKGEGPA